MHMYIMLFGDISVEFVFLSMWRIAFQNAAANRPETLNVLLGWLALMEQSNQLIGRPLPGLIYGSILGYSSGDRGV